MSRRERRGCYRTLDESNLELNLERRSNDDLGTLESR